VKPATPLEYLIARREKIKKLNLTSLLSCSFAVFAYISLLLDEKCKSVSAEADWKLTR
jgi:hypothetical protein